MIWIQTDDKLPPEGKYVLGIHNRGTWHDSTDQEHVNMVIVKLRKGLSQEERRQMKAGEIEDPEDGPYSSMWGGESMANRSSITSACDENGNNKRPYNWEPFGPDSFFGQAITHWMELPSPPVEYIMGNNKHVPIMEKVEAMVEDIKKHPDFSWLFGSDKYKKQ